MTGGLAPDQATGRNPDDHTTLDADALPALIAQIRAAGYGFVTLDTLL